MSRRITLHQRVERLEHIVRNLIVALDQLSATNNALVEAIQPTANPTTEE